MVAITKAVQDKLNSLESAASGGSLPAHLNQFIRQTVNGVYAAPGNFPSAQAMLDHLETLTYLIELHVYKRS